MSGSVEAERQKLAADLTAYLEALRFTREGPKEIARIREGIAARERAIEAEIRLRDGVQARIDGLAAENDADRVAIADLGRRIAEANRQVIA
jgi:hypothetical protein